MNLYDCKIENVEGIKFQFYIMIAITNDELWDWADKQTVATIHDVSINGDMVTIMPLWFDDTTPEVEQAFQADFFDHFVEKML